jgi:hypothetical protein
MLISIKILLLVLFFLVVNYCQKEYFNQNNNILMLDEYCLEFINFADKIKTNNPDVKFEKYMYLKDNKKKLELCRNDIIKTFKIKNTKLPITNPFVIYIYKCMLENDNWNDYRKCFKNAFENIFTE